MNIRRLTRDALLAGIALILFIVEAQLPPLTPIPGIKAGLANIITVFAVFALGPADAAAILAVRILLGALVSGSLSMLMYSAAGGLMFRLGLSFKRRTVALWIGLLPLLCAWYLHKCRVWYILLAIAAVGALLYWLVCKFTDDLQWKEWRKRFIIPAMWVSAIGFGLLHLRAFSVLNAQLLPFAITTILVPMAGGCAITYARVNLGFWWGVLLHCLINLPGVIVIASSVL